MSCLFASMLGMNQIQTIIQLNNNTKPFVPMKKNMGLNTGGVNPTHYS